MDGMKLSFPPESPPLSVIVALSLSASPVTIDSSAAATTVPSFVFSDGRKLNGATVLLRYVGRSAKKLPDFYGNNAFDSSQVSILCINMKVRIF
jgi:glutamyl-tRNA synthetase